MTTLGIIVTATLLFITNWRRENRLRYEAETARMRDVGTDTDTWGART